ncbi:MAG: hypothetical protein JXR76_23220 [Deltaproteobacteria bacterium]|nr:hypothetical protein [Deltaproteobacteria bacterium]
MRHSNFADGGFGPQFRITAFVAVVLLFCWGCNSDDKTDTGGGLDTETALEGVEINGTDNRRITSECTADEECDDGDPCTLGYCVLGECAYRHDFIPVYSKQLDVSGEVSRASIIGERVYATLRGDTPSIQIYNVPSIAEATLRDSAILTGQANALAVTWNAYAIGFSVGGIQLFSTDNLSTPAYAEFPDIGVLEQIDIVTGVAISNNNLWVAGYEEGVTLITGDIGSPNRVGTVDTIGRAVAIDARGGSALVADSLGGVVSITQQDNVPVAGTPVTTIGRVVDVDSNHRSAIVAEYGAGFSLLDVSNMSAPRRLVRVETKRAVVAVKMIGAQTALVLFIDGTLWRVGFLNYKIPRLMEVVKLGGKPIENGLDFYNAQGVVTMADGRVILLHNGCTYE